MKSEVRLIDYDAAIDRYYAEYEKQDICCGSQDRDWLKKCFDEAPTIDPETLRPKGRWNAKGYCTNCGNRCIGNDYEEWRTKYCPYCGAKMKGTVTLD